MSTLLFNSDILINGVNPYVIVSYEQARLIKPHWRKPMPVIVRINDKPDEGWRINMMPAGEGYYYLYLDGKLRKMSQTEVGDLVKVSIEFDEGYKSGPMHPIPTLLQNVLDQDIEARKRWDRLSPSRQKEVLRYLDKIKSIETKTKNIERMIDILLGKSDHFMGRDWNAD